MDYLILIKDLYTEYESEIVVKESLPASKFAELVRREMTLDYSDSIYHRLICNGKIYMNDDAISEYADMLSEGADDPNDLERRSDIYKESTYTPYKNTRVAELFTVIGSACTYIQAGKKIRCTLLDRDDAIF